MTEKELNNEYFEWMCQLVYDERYTRRLSYQMMFVPAADELRMSKSKKRLGGSNNEY